MVDYTKDTGSGGTMLIRDLGSKVEYWIKAGSTNTFAYQAPYSWYYNGSSGSGTFRYETGGDWLKVRSFTVTTEQTVQFNLGSTGTSGLGGPTNFSKLLIRTSAPPKPPPWAIEVINDDRVRGDIDGFGDGGLPILETQVGYGTSSSSPSSYAYMGTNGYGWVTGLNPKTTYYFWVRTQNSKGWSPWSNRTTAKTHAVPDAPSTPTFSEVTQTSVKVSFQTNATNGAAITSNTIGYGLSSAGPTNTFPTTPTSNTVLNLIPGETYYFWARSTNTYGNSVWSGRAMVILVAGAWVDVNGVKKRAVPYVKYNGLWKVAKPYVKIAGMWKGTQ